jgi:hypothetical protein
LLDANAGLLRVFVNGLKISPAAPGGFAHANWQQVAEFSVDASGRTTPEVMKVVVPPPWPELQVLDGWPVDERAAVRRLDVRRRVERDANAAGLTLDGVLNLFDHASRARTLRVHAMDARIDVPRGALRGAPVALPQ